MSPQPLGHHWHRVVAQLEQVGQYRPPQLILLLWGGLTGAIASQWYLHPEPLGIQVLEIGIPLLLALPLLFTAWHVSAVERSREQQARVLVMSLLFMVIASGTVAVIVLSEVATGGSFEEMLFPLIVSSSVGASVGSLVGIIHDEVIATHGELETEVEQTRLLNQRLTVFNRVLRHNVRNTLTVALGLINLVVERLEESDTREKLLRSRRALESLHSTTEKALDIDHLQAKDQETVEMNVATVIKHACEQAETQAPAATVRTDLPTDLSIRAHPLLPVAIEEGIQNAIKHNQPTELTIEISVEPQTDWVRITIADNGAGIPVGEAESLNLDEETPLQHGSGVGLWLMKWIAEESNGSFRVYSPGGGGTTVHLDVPAL